MQKNHCDILCHSVEKQCSILARKPSYKVEVPLNSRLSVLVWYCQTTANG